MECKVASSSPVGDKFFRHSFDLYRCNCAQDEQVVLSESVILWNFNFRNEGLVAIFKKTSSAVCDVSVNRFTSYVHSLSLFDPMQNSDDSIL